YEKRREYTRTRMVQLAPYLVADSIESYCADYIDGESVGAIFEPSELEEGLAFRQSISPDLAELLREWTLGFCPLKLVGVENLVFAAAWQAAGHAEPPSFQGIPYEHMVDDPATPVDEAHMFEPHYDRHVWLYRDNPNGMFKPFNPSVSCEHHQRTAVDL